MRVLFTDRCGTGVKTVFDQFLSNRAEIDDDLTGLDLVDLERRNTTKLGTAHLQIH